MSAPGAARYVRRPCPERRAFAFFPERAARAVARG